MNSSEGSFKIATWNVNSLPVRLEQVLDFLQSQSIDLLALQETKVIDNLFPNKEFEEAGYYTAFFGQKAYNGVAFLSKKPLNSIKKWQPLEDDDSARFLAVTVDNFQIINLYVPNGAHIESDKYIYKLNWLNKVYDYVKKEQQNGEKIIVLGDFNIAPQDNDTHDPNIWSDTVLTSLEVRKIFNKILDLGFYDSIRHLFADQKIYTWWDYRAGAFFKNHGLRIDHILVDKTIDLEHAYVNIDARKNKRPSDHAPLCLTIKHKNDICLKS